MKISTNLSISVSDSDIAAISALSNIARANLAALINSTDPQLIFESVEGKEGKQIICPLCGSGSGKHHTGASITFENGVWLYHCFACDSFKGDLIKIIADANHLSTYGKDFFQILAIASKILGIYPSADETYTIKKISNSTEIKTTPVEFEQLDTAKKNLPIFIENQGNKWRGLSLETLQILNCGFLSNVYFPATEKELPAIVIPNDAGGVYFRSIQGKFHKNNKPMNTTTIFLPNSNEFDLIITEGQINAASIFQAVPNPKFGIMACSGTSGENLILDKLKKLKSQGKKIRVILAFDNDSNNAGQKAAVKLRERLIAASFTTCTMDITKTPDIDLNDVLQRQGEEKLAQMIQDAVKLAQLEFQKFERDETASLFGESSANYFSEHFQSDIDENQKFINRKTGFQNLDDELKFFLPGVYVLGGITGLGKTTFALQLLEQLAQNGEHCIFCSYEMSKKFLYSKRLAREIYKIESHNFSNSVKFPLTSTQIFMNNINNFHKNAFNEALKILKEDTNPIYIWELDDIDINNLLTRLEKICTKIDKPPIVCIDYLQILAAGSENTKNTLDGILHKIFNFRRETDTTFILISSLNRANYNTEISYESLKESGCIEFSADGIWGLQLLLDKRTHADAEKAMKDIPRQIQLKCLKNRFGSKFDIGFFYYPNCDTFIPMLEYGDFTDFKSNGINSVPSANDDT